MLSDNSNFTIPTVLNLKTLDRIETNDFFNFDTTNNNLVEERVIKLRRKIEKDIQNNTIEYVCLYCKQAVTIRGQIGGIKTFHFTHLKNSDECLYKTTKNLTVEEVNIAKYNGQKESARHQFLKNKIGEILSLQDNIETVSIDKIFKNEAVSKKWRKPDVLAQYKDGKKVAFEVQVTTTFVSIIVGRSEFYKQQSINLLWIFDCFSTEIEMQTFTQKDIFYHNNCNVFVFTGKAEELSNKNKKLFLLCYYKKPLLIKKNSFNREATFEIDFEWKQEYVCFDDLTFKNDMIYFFDYASEVDRLKAELEKQEREKKEAIELAKLRAEALKEKNKQLEKDKVTRQYNSQQKEIYQTLNRNPYREKFLRNKFDDYVDVENEYQPAYNNETTNRILLFILVETDYLAPNEQETLVKIVEAVGLTFAQTQKITIAKFKPQPIDYPHYFISFSLQRPPFIINEKYQVVKRENKKLLWVDTLEVLVNEKPKKSQLWKCLKEMFEIK